MFARATGRPAVTFQFLFIRQKDDVENILYNPPVGMSDHALLEYNFLVANDVINDEENKKTC